MMNSKFNFALAALICSIMFLNVLQAKAQCVPDSSITSLYSPDINEGLPDGSVSLHYETVITLNVPADTTYLTFTAEIDSMVLQNVSGLPPGFSYSCTPSSCSFVGGELACILVSGITNNNAHALTWDIEADFLFYLKQPAITLPYTLSGYSITLDSVAVGIAAKHDENLRFMLEPNPINPLSKLVFDLPAASSYTLDIYSLLGSNVIHIEGQGKRGGNAFSLGEFYNQPGVYFVTVNQGNYSRSMRFIVQ